MTRGVIGVAWFVLVFQGLGDRKFWWSPHYSCFYSRDWGAVGRALRPLARSRYRFRMSWNPPLELDLDTMRVMAARVSDLVTAHLASLREQPARTSLSRPEAKRLIGTTLSVLEN